MALDFEIQYKQGQANKVVGALSIMHSSEVILYASSTISIDLLEKIKDSLEKDQKIQSIIQSLQNGVVVKHYLWCNGQLLKKEKLVTLMIQN